MPSTFSKNLGLELMVTGENPGTWGNVTNINLEALDDAIDGVVDVNVGAGGAIVTTADAPALSDGRSRVLNFIGTPNENAPITIAPSDCEKTYFVRNLTAQPLLFGQGAGSRYTLNAGYSAVIQCNGMGDEASVFGTLSSFQCDKLIVKGPAEVTGSISIAGAVTLKEAVWLEKTLRVDGITTLNGNLNVTGAATVTFGTGVVTIGGPVTINNTLTSGAATVSSLAAGTGAITGGSLAVTGAVTGASLSAGTGAVSGGAGSFSGVVSSGDVTAAGSVIATGSVTSGGVMYANGGLRINIGADATNDMYYRGSDGTLLRVAPGAAGQFLRVQSGGAPAWLAGDPDPPAYIVIGSPVYGFSGVGNVLWVGNSGPPNFTAALRTGGLFWDGGDTSNGFLEISRTAIMGLTFNSTDNVLPYQVIHFNLKSAYRWKFGMLDVFPLTDIVTDWVMAFQRFDNNGLAYTPYSINFAIARGTGRVHMGGINGDCSGAVNIQPLSALTVGLVIRRAGQQTAHMQDWQHEGGTPLAWVTFDGRWGQTLLVARAQAEENLDHILAQPHLVQRLKEALAA